MYKIKKGLVAVLVLVEIFSFSAPVYASTSASPIAPGTITSLANKERLARNIKALTVNPILNQAAQMKAENMAKYGYFAHTSPRGLTPWYWFVKAGYRYEYAGENLAVNFSNSKSLTKAWMKSPTHKANIVDRHYTEVGTGMAVGYLNGKKVTFIAQVYGNPV